MTRTQDLEQVGTFTVDSGIVMIGDPCYLDRWNTEELPADPDEPIDPYGYAAACEVALSPEGAGDLDCEASVVAAVGDGIYPVFVERDARGRITAIHIRIVPTD